MSLDQNSTNVILGLFGVLNTALLVWQAVRVGEVHTAVNSTHAAAVLAARDAGVAAGMLAVTAASAGASPPLPGPLPSDTA